MYRMPGYEMAALSLLISISLYLLNRMPQQKATSHTDQKLEIQKRMVAFIARHYAEPITLGEIAASANLSKSSCIRFFKIYVGQSPFDFLITYRLNAACDLLTRTEKSVTEITALCGFNHTSYFSKMFRRLYGCSPKEYRKKQKEQRKKQTKWKDIEL